MYARPHIAPLAGILACTAIGAAAQQPDFSQVRVESQKLADGVYMLTGQGGNIGVSAGEDGVILIDDQFAPLVPKIREAVARLSAEPIRFVINTHWHGDHTGGNEELGKAGSVVVAHGNVRRRLSVEQVRDAGRRTPPAPPAALPIVTFDRAVTLHYNGDDLEVMHVPNAHTDGDAIIRFRKANVVHMGDVFFNYRYPFIDGGSGGSISGVISAVDAVLATLDDRTRVIPGHGPLATKAELAAYRDMLSTVRDRIARLIEAGKTQDEVVASRPTREFDEKWASGTTRPDAWVAQVYAGMRRGLAAED
jgi:cyclase